MSLGLTRDSMLNLAELAQLKEENEKHSGPDITLEDGKDETLVMHLSTHEIEALDEAEMKAQEEEIATRKTEKLDEGSGGTIPDTTSRMSGDSDDSFHSATSELGKMESKEDSELSQPSAPAPAPETSYGAYSGFSTDYAEYENYDFAAYNGNHLLVAGNKSQKPFWCCLFPWINKGEDDDDTDMQSSEEMKNGQESFVDVQENGRDGPPLRSGSKDDDEVSTGSDVFGERLSDKDRQAVLARLRLVEPDAKSPASPGAGAEPAPAEPSPVEIEKGLLNETDAKKPRSRSILKRPSTLSGANLKDAGDNGSLDAKGKRRSLFPSYETKSKPNKNLNVDFSPMARVLTVKSQKDMDEKEKSEIWWQRSDYEEFRKTGRMITKAMLEGGSEIWLATNQSWQLPNKDKHATLKNACSLAEQHAAFEKGDVSAKKNYEETRDKWWHKFGHSRRGLEHIASIDEGRQRQNNVRTALRAVVEEQRRQKVFRREDPEKLRMVSLQHTSWARDLALAAGASDADAVQMNFDDESRKSREFYLLKFSRSNQMNVHSTKKASVPAFMKPALSLQVQPSILDANTVPQICYRQTQHRRRASGAPTAPSSTTSKADKAEQTMQIKLDDDKSSSSSMAKQAAGFASGEEIGNMSSVLTGMGIAVGGES